MYEVPSHILEYCPFKLQRKQFYLIFHTLSPCLPAPAHTSHPCFHHISTGCQPTATQPPTPPTFKSISDKNFINRILLNLNAAWLSILFNLLFFVYFIVSFVHLSRIFYYYYIDGLSCSFCPTITLFYQAQERSGPHDKLPLARWRIS